MQTVFRSWVVFVAIIIASFFVWSYISTSFSEARNIMSYSDVISDSNPNTGSNHTFSFILQTAISPGAYIEILPPADFEILSTSTFSADRNVELYVDDVVRNSSSTLSASEDMVEIFSGMPGSIKYTLNSTEGIPAGSEIQIKIGNHTSKTNFFSESYSTTTGTTTIEADIKPIINGLGTGSKKIAVKIYDGTLVADANFMIAILERVGVGPIDTTEEIPPLRFGGSPTGTITGVTLNVEIFLQTDEFATCKYDTVAGTSYQSMPYTFTNTGLIYHSKNVPVVPNSVQQFYVRCIDDEGNFNPDDYLIEFSVSATPTGTSNTEGDVSGDGTGSGNDGSGSGSGGGGTSGSSDGEAPSEGGASGGGGSGGGGGGGSGGGSGSTSGGGFESTDAPYRSGDGRVVITGYAFPNSEVVSLVDGKESEKSRAGNDGEYSITIDEIARGAYTFGVYAVDANKNKSSTFSTSFTVAGARTSALSNINISPTVTVSPDPVNPGQTLTASGYAIPNSEVTIENLKENSAASLKNFSASADGGGVWSTTISTAGFSNGTYKIRAKSKQTTGFIATNFSNYLLYGVGEKATKPTTADLNRDGKVNLTDFSILLFWWNTDGGTSDPSADINGDKKVNLTDFSILLFNWTG
ncbi:MAG: hypothetical protein KBC78_00535 [Candidatus Pacebacteria bacterium]|jgi:hypothetical protein|nr:hypothetical protein [Candidatus Paceibacterota bacterium]